MLGPCPSAWDQGGEAAEDEGREMIKEREREKERAGKTRAHNNAAVVETQTQMLVGDMQ